MYNPNRINLLKIAICCIHSSNFRTKQGGGGSAVVAKRYPDNLSTTCCYYAFVLWRCSRINFFNSDGLNGLLIMPLTFKDGNMTENYFILTSKAVIRKTFVLGLICSIFRASSNPFIAGIRMSEMTAS